jgi:hypothetical protein
MNAFEFLQAPETKTWLRAELEIRAPEPFATPTQKNQPNLGIIAGGAPANLLLGKWTGHAVPIRDIDIFMPSSTGKYQYEHTYIPIKGVETNDYDQITGYLSHYYKLQSSKTIGRLNYITVGFSESIQPEEYAATLIAGFDINATMVAYDIQSDKIIWTEAFPKFLQSRQLHVESLTTPWRTAIRLAVKAKELPCYCNLDNEFEILNQPYAIAQRNKMTKGEHGKEELYNKLQRHLTTTNKEKLLRCWPTLQHHYELCLNKADSTKFTETVIPHPNMMGDTTTEHNFYTLRPKNPVTIRPEFEPCSNKTITHQITLNRLIQATRARKHIKKNTLMLATKKNTEILLIENPALPLGNFTEADVTKTNTFLEKHTRLRHMLKSPKQFNFEQLNKALGILQTLEKQRKSGFIGHLETSNTDQSNEISRGASAWKEQINTWYVAGTINLIEPAPLTGMNEAMNQTDTLWMETKPSEPFGNWNIQELTSRDSLETEGNRMHHCVGGYASILETGKSRIFHIETNDGATTCEFRKFNEQSPQHDAWNISQHYAKSNKQAPKRNHLVAHTLKHILNTNLNQIPVQIETTTPTNANALL